MPPGYDGLVQENPYKAPQTQPQQAQPQASQPNAWANQSVDLKTSQNLNTGSGQSSGSGLSAADWAAIAGILGEYFGKDNKANFRNVPLSPEQQELYKRAMGYLDNSPTRNYLMPQIDQRLRSLGSSQFKMPQTMGGYGLPQGTAGQTFYQPGGNQGPGGVPPLGPLVTQPTGERPTTPPHEPGDRPDRPRDDRGGPPERLDGILDDFFNRLNQNQLDQMMRAAQQDPQTMAAMERAGGFQAWFSSGWQKVMDYARANPGNVSGLMATIGTIYGGMAGAFIGRLLAAAINRALRGGGGGGADRPGGAGGPGDGGPSGPNFGSGPGGGRGTLPDDPSTPGGSVDTEGSYYDPTTGKWIKF